MAYEYESDIPKFLKGIEYEHPLDLSKEIKEIQEVYRKAKVFDKLVEFYPQKDEIPSDEFFMMMGYIIKERADDER